MVKDKKKKKSNKKKKAVQTSKTKKPKTKVVNMIDIYYSRINDYDKYPNQIIDNELYLGMLEQASKKHILDNLSITHIINVTPTDYPDMTVIENRKYYQISIADIKDVCIADYFDETYKFIDNALKMNNNNDNDIESDENKDNDESNTNNCNKTNRVLVHCKEGVSRSASIVISYLMKSRNMKLNETLEYVKNRREVVDPNSGFKEQLKEFEKNGYTVKPKQH